MNERENRTQEQLLTELLAYQKKEVRHTRVATLANIVLVVALVVALVTLLPRALDLVSHVESSLTELDGLMSEVGTAVDSANVAIVNANQMVEDNADAVTQTMQKLQDVDFEKLNEAIGNLNDTVRPLANFARAFG